MYHKVEVKTEIGNLTVTVTRLDHVHVNTASGTFVTVRGKEYTVSVHLFLVDGNWKLKDSRDGGYATVTKREYTSYSQSSAAPTIAVKVVEHCREALAKVLADDPFLPARQEVDSLTRDIARLTEERSKLLVEVGSKFKEIQKLTVQRKKLEKVSHGH